jgi:hypothetical protein
MAESATSTPQQQLLPTLPPLGSSHVPARALLIALTSSNIFALIIGGIYEYLALRGVVSTRAAWAVLVFVWLLGVVPIVISERVWGKGPRQRIWSGIIAAVVLGAILVGFDTFISHALAKPQSTPPPSASVPAAPVIINQSSTDSDCTNLVAGSDSRVQCESERQSHGKKQSNH